MKIKFLPQNISIDVQSGKSVMELAKENKIPVSSSCNGMCSCAECRVYVVEGEAHVLPPSAKEVELIGEGHFIDRRRLSCQLFCFGNVTIDMSEQVEREQQGGVRKQFLKQFSKEGGESSSVGGVLVEQDQEMNKVEIPEETESDVKASLSLRADSPEKSELDGPDHLNENRKKGFRKKKSNKQNPVKRKKNKSKKKKKLHGKKKSH